MSFGKGPTLKNVGTSLHISLEREKEGRRERGNEGGRSRERGREAISLGKKRELFQQSRRSFFSIRNDVNTSIYYSFNNGTLGELFDFQFLSRREGYFGDQGTGRQERVPSNLVSRCPLGSLLKGRPLRRNNQPSDPPWCLLDELPLATDRYLTTFSRW